VVAGEMEWKFVAFAAIAIGIAAAAALRSWRAFACFGGYLAGTLLLASMGFARFDRLQHTFSFTLFLGFAFLIVDAPARLEARAGRAEWALPGMVAATVAFLYLGFLLPNEWRDIYLLEVHPHGGRALKVADDPRIDRSLYYTGQRRFVYTRHDELPVGAVRKYRALRVQESDDDNDGFVSPNTFVD